MPDLPIVHQPAVNEELGATAVMGSQLAPGRPDARYEGVVGVWYGKAPGLDRAGDALRHGVFAGASPKGGALVLVGDDPACSSSTMPSSSDATLVDLHMPILYPGTTEECLELGLHAVAMSRASGLWSSMKIVTPVADGFGTVTCLCWTPTRSSRRTTSMVCRGRVTPRRTSSDRGCSRSSASSARSACRWRGATAPPTG